MGKHLAIINLISSIAIVSMNLLTNDILLVSELLSGYEEVLWPKKLRSSDFGSFLVI